MKDYLENSGVRVTKEQFATLKAKIFSEATRTEKTPYQALVSLLSATD